MSPTIWAWSGSIIAAVSPSFESGYSCASLPVIVAISARALSIETPGFNRAMMLSQRMNRRRGTPVSGINDKGTQISVAAFGYSTPGRITPRIVKARPESEIVSPTIEGSAP